MRITRLTAGAAGLAGLSLVLAACGGTAADGGDTAATAGAGGTGDEGGDITLTVATFNEFGYEDLITEYEAEQPDITIEHQKAATSDEARDNMNTRLAAGSGLADIEAIEVDWMPEIMQYADQFVDLSDPALEGRWLDWKVEQATTADGKLIGYGTDIGPEAVCYRSDLFAAAGLPDRPRGGRRAPRRRLGHYFEVGKQFIAKTSDVPWFDSAGAIYQGMVNQVEAAYEEPDGDPMTLADEHRGQGPVRPGPHGRASTTTSRPASSQWSDDWTNAFQNDGFATMLCPGWMLGVIEGNAAGRRRAGTSPTSSPAAAATGAGRS